MPILIGLSLAFAIFLCVHAVRTGQAQYWLWIILMFQPLGGVVYLVAVYLPEVFGSPTAQRLQATARHALDPTREYREAQTAVEDSPTVRNQSRLAEAAAALGRHDEAERLYRDAAHGIHAEDPTLLLGRANALIELGRNQEARTALDKLGENVEDGRTPAAALALGRANEGLGRVAEAEDAYQWALERMPGFEAAGRYAAFLARSGRRKEAEDLLADIDRRIVKTNRHFRAEAKSWRDLAAQAIGGGAA